PALSPGAHSRVAPAANGAPASSQESRKNQKRLEAERRQANSRQRKAHQEVVDQLEQQIQQLEQRQRELVAELEQPETYEKAGRPQEINRDLVAVQEHLEELNPRWEKAATKLTAFG